VLKGAGAAYAALCFALLGFTFLPPGAVAVTLALFSLAAAQSATLLGYGLVSARVAPQLQGTIAGTVNVAPWMGTAVFQFLAGILVQALFAQAPSPPPGEVYAATLVPLAVIGLAALPLAGLIQAGREQPVAARPAGQDTL
jgi:hypothetical protein